jgi:hypothetical protein
MEIGPVTSIRALPVVRPLPADPELSGVFDIENFARIGDETYSPSGGKSAGGGEDEFDDPAVEDEDEFQPRVADPAPPHQISFFA